MSTTTHFTTVAEIEQAGTPEGRWEVIDGELVEMSPTGEQHWALNATLIYRISAFVIPRRLGLVLTPDAGVVLPADLPRVRVPDVGFVRYDRLPPNRDRTKFLEVVPDLIVEVTSPSDRPVEVIAKALLWLDAGAALVWAVDPGTRTVTIFKRGQQPGLLTIDDTLDGDEVLPGFALPLRELFAA